MIGRPAEGLTECSRVNGQQLSTCMRAETESVKGEQMRSNLFNIRTETTTDQVSRYLY